MDEIRVGTFSPSVILEVARTTGRLETHNLDVTAVPVASSPAQFRALADGDLAVGLTSPDNVIAYRFEPTNPLGTLLDARMVGAVDRGLGLAVYARPGLGAAELTGAKLGVDVPSSGFALALYALCESLGLGRESYDVVALGSTPRRLEALLAGACAATMLNAGNELVAEREGCVQLATVADRLSPYLGTVVAVVGEAHLPTALRLATALRESTDAVLAGLLDQAVTEAAVKLLGFDTRLANRYLARLRNPDEGLVSGGLVDPAALETLIGIRTRYLPGSAPAHRLLDPSSGLVHQW